MQTIITTTRASWGLSEASRTPHQHGESGRVQGLCVAQSAGAGQGQVGSMGGNSKRPQSRYDGFKRWPGKGLGVRGPMSGETPLSKAEVEHGINVGLIDGLPIRQHIKRVGEWETKSVKQATKAHPFDGLMP